MAYDAPSSDIRSKSLPAQASVLIIGAGPVGLGLGLDLTRRGVDCLVIDTADGVVRHSKMGVVSARTMEFCRRWGVADKVRSAGFPEDYVLNQVYCTGLNGHLIGTTHYPSMRDEPRTPDSPEHRQRCPQLWFDPILSRAVASSTVSTLRYECELLEFTQHDTGVTATVRDRLNGTAKVEARYLVGCDGAGSDVRRALGIKTVGDQVLNYSVAIYFNCPNLLQLHDKGPAERYLMFGDEGNWGHLTVVDGRALWRLTVMGSTERLDMNRFDADAWVRRCLGRSASYTIESILPWRRSKLVAERYGSGRVFLCGDAVHAMSPNGGFGMNTGMGDAVDLAWKLHARLAGWGGPHLLESYEAERRPVGLRNTFVAANNFARIANAIDWRGVADDGEVGAAKRREIGPVLENAARGNVETVGITLGYRYDGSPICIGDGSPATPDEARAYVPTARPGHRAPHAWLGPGQSILDLFGDGFMLLRLGAAPPGPAPLLQAAQAQGVPMTARTIEDAAVARLYGRRLVLVRPDGHVAWRSDDMPSDPERIVGIVAGRTTDAQQIAPQRAI